MSQYMDSETQQYYMTAYSSYVNGNYEKCRNCLNILLKLWPDNYMVRILEGGYYISIGNIRKALAIYDSLLECDIGDILEDEIQEITEHLIYYSTLEIASRYPNVANLNKRAGKEL